MPDNRRITVTVAGATGLVGRHCVEQLLELAARPTVVALVRDPARAAFATHPRLRVRGTDYDRLDAVADAFAADAVVCALGTTLARAGSRQAFRRVDFDYALATARLAKRGGARHFLLVSALGADARSGVFYSRVKGELEQAVLALGLPAVTILRPSLLLGKRGEFRLGEELAKHLGWLAPARYRPIEAAVVAGALAQAAVAPAPPRRIVESREIAGLAA
jgi:uncharacterized protein YbjT (DUF2867 family)